MPDEEVFSFVPVETDCNVQTGMMTWRGSDKPGDRYVLRLNDQKGYEEAMTRVLVRLMRDL